MQWKSCNHLSPLHNRYYPHCCENIRYRSFYQFTAGVVIRGGYTISNSVRNPREHVHGLNNTYKCQFLAISMQLTLCCLFKLLLIFLFIPAVLQQSRPSEVAPIPVSFQQSKNRKLGIPLTSNGRQHKGLCCNCGESPNSISTQAQRFAHRQPNMQRYITAS